MIERQDNSRFGLQEHGDCGLSSCASPMNSQNTSTAENEINMQKQQTIEAQALKAQIKSWERVFFSQNGRRPTRLDVQNNTEILQLYIQYARMKGRKEQNQLSSSRNVDICKNIKSESVCRAVPQECRSSLKPIKQQPEHDLLSNNEPFLQPVAENSVLISSAEVQVIRPSKPKPKPEREPEPETPTLQHIEGDGVKHPKIVSILPDSSFSQASVVSVTLPTLTPPPTPFLAYEGDEPAEKDNVTARVNEKANEDFERDPTDHDSPQVVKKGDKEADGIGNDDSKLQGEEKEIESKSGLVRADSTSSTGIKEPGTKITLNDMPSQEAPLRAILVRYRVATRPTWNLFVLKNQQDGSVIAYARRELVGVRLRSVFRIFEANDFAEAPRSQAKWRIGPNREGSVYRLCSETTGEITSLIRYTPDSVPRTVTVAFKNNGGFAIPEDEHALCKAAMARQSRNASLSRPPRQDQGMLSRRPSSASQRQTPRVSSVLLRSMSLKSVALFRRGSSSTLTSTAGLASSTSINSIVSRSGSENGIAMVACSSDQKTLIATRRASGVAKNPKSNDLEEEIDNDNAIDENDSNADDDGDEKEDQVELEVQELPQQIAGSTSFEDAFADPLGVELLRNRVPRYSMALRSYCLNFSGRVTMPSVKNFQLAESSSGRIVLQFGRVGRDEFHMDLGHGRMSVCAALATCLTTFDASTLY